MRWAERSRKAFDDYKNPNALFGIIQGGMYNDLRERSMTELMNIGFDGMAIGDSRLVNPKKRWSECWMR